MANDKQTTPAANIRSNLEGSVLRMLSRASIDFEYEAHAVPVIITVNTQPDVFLPHLQTVLEVKGKCQTNFEFRKLVATSAAVRETLVLEGVQYKHYVIAVQVSAAEMAQYMRAMMDINKLMTTTQRGNFPLTGLRLVAALQRAHVEAVPITYDKAMPLIQVLKRKQGLLDGLNKVKQT